MNGNKLNGSSAGVTGGASPGYHRVDGARRCKRGGCRGVPCVRQYEGTSVVSLWLVMYVLLCSMEQFLKSEMKMFNYDLISTNCPVVPH